MLLRLFKLILTIIIISIIVYVFSKFFPDTYFTVKHFLSGLVDEAIALFHKMISWVSNLFH